MKIHGILGPLLLALAASCATYRLQPVEQNGASLRQERAQTLAVVKRDGLTLETSAVWAPEILFDLKFTNNSGKTVTLDSDHFEVYTGDLKNWTKVALITSAEYYSREEKRYFAGTVVAAFSAAASPTYRRTTTTSVIETGNGSTLIITETHRTASPSANFALARLVADSGKKKLDWLKDNLFYSVDLEPGHSYEGLVYASSGRGDYYKLVVPFDQTTLELIFQKVREGSPGPFINLD